MVLKSTQKGETAIDREKWSKGHRGLKKHVKECECENSSLEPAYHRHPVPYFWLNAHSSMVFPNHPNALAS
jgi:hypothetical protein